jgi:ATP-dependent DNA helicase RecQ
MRTYDRSRALALLRAGAANPVAEFRDGQEEAIRHVLSGKGRLLVVQATGWGKSMVYFVATKLLRESGGGPALLVSPLLALMRNQLEAAGRMGLRAETVNSDNTDDWDDVEESIKAGEVDLLLVSPERLANDRFRREVLARVGNSVSMLVVDEAHCISDWGHDFRPHYRLLARLIGELPRSVRLIATTATANNRVMADLEAVLGPGLQVVRGKLSRPSLHLQTIQLPAYPDRMAWVAQTLRTIKGSGIVYALTVRDVEFLASWLRYCGISAEAYHGDAENRPKLEDDLMSNRVKALVATTALGMGFDKPDVAFVIHFQAPGSVVHYYQQVGRAGRAIDRAHGVLLSGAEDGRIVDFFIRSAFPTREESLSVLTALRESSDWMTENHILARVNIRAARLRHILQLLSLESPAPVVGEGKRWRLSPPGKLAEEFWDRVARLSAIRRAEHEEMSRYVGLASGHMAFLMKALDGEDSPAQPARAAVLPAGVDGALRERASAFLRSRSLSVKPRKLWPEGGLSSIGSKGLIAEADRMEEGRVLSAWGDGEWGALVERGKREGRFDDALVAAAAELVRGWSPRPTLRWVTCIPSLGRPMLVPDFARRLAASLGLPFAESLTQVKQRAEQKSMQNWIQQARNIDGTLAISGWKLSKGPVLLVDDVVDSRWTMTVAACLLRRAGVEAVFPFALADTGAES